MVFQRGGCVYIVTNKTRAVLYIGVTSDIRVRIWEHKNKIHPDSFTAKYNCDRLVYYCGYPHIEEAIAAEKSLKKRKREYKEKLIAQSNPTWDDLFDTLED
jgi:putative endonuclease